MIKAIKKKEHEIMSGHQSSLTPTSTKDIEPPKLHRDMRHICDVFRISEESRFALRTFDAATLDDFSLMTESDFLDLVATRARLGCPLPPLQQRKLAMLRILVQLQSLPAVESTVAPMRSEGFEVKNNSTEEVKFRASVKKDLGRHTPSDWEDRFYADLPRLRKELRETGEERNSNFIMDLLSLRWLFCYR